MKYVSIQCAVKGCNCLLPDVVGSRQTPGGVSRTSTPTLYPSFVRRDPRNTEATKAAWSRVTWMNLSSSSNKQTKKPKHSKSNQIRSNKTFLPPPGNWTCQFAQDCRSWRTFDLSIFLPKHTHTTSGHCCCLPVQSAGRKLLWAL